MKNKVQQTVSREALDRPALPVIAAVSGGADSVALLHWLHANWPAQVTAVHVHHGIRGAEADRDAAFVAQLCRTWTIPCVIHRADIPALAAERRRGLEETARSVRYELLEQEAERQHGVVATAHTLSDQTETVLLNLTRGTGGRGLCGIPYRRGNIIRPLLDCTRAEIEAYCRENGLDYVEDSTNRDCAYARNRLRHRVIPELRQINGGIEQSVGRMTRRMRDWAGYIARETDALAARAEVPGGYDAAVLRTAPAALRSEALRLICCKAGLTSDLSDRHVAAMERLIEEGGTENLPGGYRAVQQSGRLTVRPPETAPELLPEIVLTGLPERLSWGGRQFVCSVETEKNSRKVYKKSLYHLLNYDTIAESRKLVWRSRRAGDVFHPAGRVRKTLKKLFNEAGIPVKQRNRQAILEADGQIVWVEGFGASEAARPVPGRPVIIIAEENSK